MFMGPRRVLSKPVHRHGGAYLDSRSVSTYRPITGRIRPLIGRYPSDPRTATSWRTTMPRIKFCSPDIEAAYEKEQDVSKKVMLSFAGIMGHVPKANKYLVATQAAA